MHVLVVAESVLYRKILGEILTGVVEISRLTIARNEQFALAKVAGQPVDLLILDIDQPQRTGLELCEQLGVSGEILPTILLGSSTGRAASVALKACARGAVEIVTKPEGGQQPLEARAELSRQLATLVKGFAASQQRKPSASEKPSRSLLPVVQGPASLPHQRERPQIIAIGTSTGGPQALAELLGGLPRTFPVPIVVAIHMPPGFTGHLAASLDKHCGLTVVEGQPGMRLQASTVVIAPGGRQMGLLRADGATDVYLSITDDPPENFCRPAVDYLFRAVAAAYHNRAVGVLLTGMGSDGKLGLQRLKQHQAHTVAQDEASSIIFGMPREAIAAGVVDLVLPLSVIGGHLIACVGK